MKQLNVTATKKYLFQKNKIKNLMSIVNKIETFIDVNNNKSINYFAKV